MKSITQTELFQDLTRSSLHGDQTEVIELISEMRNRVAAGDDPEEVLYEEGLEPDYVLDLL